MTSITHKNALNNFNRIRHELSKTEAQACYVADREAFDRKHECVSLVKSATDLRWYERDVARLQELYDLALAELETAQKVKAG